MQTLFTLYSLRDILLSLFHGFLVTTVKELVCYLSDTLVVISLWSSSQPFLSNALFMLLFHGKERERERRRNQVVRSSILAWMMSFFLRFLEETSIFCWNWRVIRLTPDVLHAMPSDEIVNDILLGLLSSVLRAETHCWRDT
jgi:hypothetical protein